MGYTKTPLRIAVQVELNRAHGRALIEGIGNYALARTEWRLEAVEPQALTNLAAMRRFDGFIVRVMDDRTASALLRTGRPVVDTYGRDDSGSIPFIRLDDAAIAALAAQCFAEHRHRRCAYCGFPGLRFSEARGAAFAAAVAKSGGECRAYGGGAPLRETEVRRERMDAAPDAPSLRSWVESLPKPIAVFCCNDLRAYHLLCACADAGVNVPRDVAVLGADNDKVLCNFANPPLSSIETNPSEIGWKAAGILDGMLSSPSAAPPPATLHRPRAVVERISTDSYQVKTPWLSDALVTVRRYLGRGLNATELCRSLGLSHTTVNKAFNAELGMSVQQYIIMRRLERACRMLRETSLTAAAISEECGYPSAQYFAHTFSAHFGTTPDKWRKAGGAGGSSGH